MARCATCGEPLGEGAQVCPVCGTRVGEKPSDAAGGGVRTRDEWLAGNAQRAGIQIGYSKRFDTPEFQAALKSSNRSFTWLVLIVVLVLPLAIALIVSLFQRQNVAVVIGILAIVELIALPIVLFIIIRRNTAKSWDGEVVDLAHHTSEKSADSYFIICRTDAGKRRRVRDYGRSLYDYLQVGDRVRFHPRLNLPLEKYDKTKDDYQLCPFCGKQQPLDNDDCATCGKPLLK